MNDPCILLDPFGGYYIPIPTIYGQDFDAPTSPLWTKASGGGPKMVQHGSEVSTGTPTGGCFIAYTQKARKRYQKV